MIARGTRVGGRVETPGSLRIDGRVEGAVSAGDRVVIAASGVVISEIQAREVEVHGIVIGNVTAEALVIVGDGGRVVGDVRAPEVEVGANAQIEGKVDRGALEPEGSPDGLPAVNRPTLRLRAPIRRPGPPSVTLADDGGPELPALVRAPADDDEADTHAGARADEDRDTRPMPALDPAGPPRRPRLSPRARLVPRKGNGE